MNKEFWNDVALKGAILGVVMRNKTLSLSILSYSSSISMISSLSSGNTTV